MKNLFVIKRVIEHKDLSDEAVCVWAALRNIMNKDMYVYFVSYNMIAWSMLNRMPSDHELRGIKKGFKELTDKEYVVVKEKYSTSEFVVDLTALYYQCGSEYFVSITDEEMNEVMNVEAERINKFSLFRFYMCMIGTFNMSADMSDTYRGKIGGMSLDSLSTIINKTKKTVLQYICTLEENNILFVIRHNDFIQYNDGQLRQLPNTYSRYRDRHLAQSYTSDFAGYKEHTKHLSGDTNKKRGLAQKYNAFCNGKEYDIETIRDMYDYCVEWNKHKLAEYNASVEKGYDAELEQKELSVFEDYLDQIKKGDE